MKIKRPLIMVAVFAAAVCFILSFFFPEVIMPEFIKTNVQALSDGDELYIEGRVYKISEKTGSVYIYLKASKAGTGESRTRAGKVLLVTAKDEFEDSGIKIGNSVLACCSYLELERAGNNGNYDEEKYYRSLGIFLKAEVTSLSITRTHTDLLPWFMYRFKTKICASFEEILGEEDSAAAGIFMAVVTGDKTSLTSGTKDLYSENGIAHILAVSGLHISLIGMGLFSLLKRPTGPYAAGAVSGAVMLLYCLMCAASLSSVRALIMFWVRMAAYFSGKTYDHFSAAALSAIAILSSEPFYILNSGFILSFTAIISVGFALGCVREFLDPGSSFADSLVFSGFITASTLPVVVYSYYTIPLYGVLLNLIVIPLMSFVLASGLLGALAGMVSAVAGSFFLGIGYYTVYFINLCCYVSSLLPASCIVAGFPGTVKVIIYYMILLAFIYLIRKICLEDRRKKAAIQTGENKSNAMTSILYLSEDVKKFIQKKLEKTMPVQADQKNQKIKRYAAFFLVLICLAAFLCVEPGKNDLEIIMFDVDQGDGLMIITPEKTVIMIDGGSTGESGLWQYTLKNAIEYEGISKIDYSIVTHPDTDHISAILDLLNDKTSPVKIENLLLPNITGNDNCDELISAAESKGVNIIYMNSGMKLETGSVVLTCIHPDADAVYDDVNDYSVTLSLTYKDFSALFTGDISAEVEEELLEEGCLLSDYDVLKVAHHGSKYSSCSDFLQEINAEIALISAGKDNSYGHPAQETLTRLEEADASVYVTAESGEIKITVKKDSSYSIWTKY